MLRKILYTALLFLGIAWSPAPGFAQRPAAGLALRITAVEGGQPLSNVRVAIEGTGQSGLTSTEGLVRIDQIPAGDHLVTISRMGYSTERLALQFEQGKTVGGEIELLSAPVQLEQIDVSARRQNTFLDRIGFHDRQRMGFGSFVTREKIEEEGYLKLSEILRRVRGVRVVPVRTGYRVVSSRSGPQMSASTVSNCYMQVFVDGISIQIDDIDEIPVGSVGAVEVYRGSAETPPVFKPTGRTCGAVVIWTRTGTN